MTKIAIEFQKAVTRWTKEKGQDIMQTIGYLIVEAEATDHGPDEQHRYEVTIEKVNWKGGTQDLTTLLAATAPDFMEDVFTEAYGRGVMELQDARRAA